MPGLMAVTLNWLHMAAAVVWLGGISFVLLAAAPSARRITEAGAAGMMAEMSRRFTRLANWSILILIVTGIGLTLVDKRQAFGSLLNGWAPVALIKYLLAAGMVAVHCFRQFVLTPRIQRTGADAQRKALSHLSRKLVKLNGGLGLLVLLLSAALVN